MARALIVDDDANFRLGLAEVLRLEGFVTVTVPTCLEARHELARGTVDLLFVDVSLPDGNGLDLLAGPGLPAVVVTGEPSLALASEALRRGARDCLAKPVDRVRVRMTLAGLARERRLEGEINGLRAEIAALQWGVRRP
jgi:DNA-binding NtrC family response regulator